MTFKPMLASPVEDDLTKLTFPLFASPKLDGIRAVVRDGVLVSRNLKPIPNVEVRFTFSLEFLEGLDGELIVGDPTSPSAFRDTTSVVMSMTHPRWSDVRFHVFDHFGLPNDTFQARLGRAEIVSKPKRHWIKPVPHELVNNVAQLEELERRWLMDGYEGVMLRHPFGPYKFGRSTAKEGWLTKLKRFADAEAQVLGVKELEHNENTQERDALGHAKRSTHKAGKRAGGVLGALRVQASGWPEEFDIGSGFTAEDRALLWAQRDSLPGRLVKFRFFPSGAKDRPRFPVFLGFRDPADL